MAWQPTPIVFLPLFTAAAFAGLAVYVYLRRSGEGPSVPVRSATAMLLLAALWIGAYSFRLASTDLAMKVFWNGIELVGFAFLPMIWLRYVVSFSDRRFSFGRSGWIALGVPPLAFLLAAATNDVHRLVWLDLSLVTDRGLVVLSHVYGPGYFAFIAYVYAVVAVAAVLLATSVRRSEGVRRTQGAVLLVASLFPTVAGIAYVSGLNPIAPLHITVMSFPLTALAVAWSVLRHDLFDLVPVARETAIEQMRTGIVVLDTDGAVSDLNSSAAALLDAPRGDLLGRSFGELADAHADRPIRLDDPPDVVEWSTGADRRHVRPSVTPVQNRRGRTVGHLVTLRDVTERRERERRLEEFASVVSHDLRNPLNVAMGTTDLAAETGDPEHFDRLRDAHDRMDRIIDDLLALARHGRDGVDDEAVDLGRAAERAWEGVSADGATLDVVAAPTIRADRDALLRLLENLFRNAVEHGATGDRASRDDVVEHGASTRPAPEDPTDGGSERNGPPDAPRVRVEVGSLADGSGFYVADDGPGISPDERDRVFEHGYTTSDDGTGLGLAIVREIADAHGWSVEIADDADGTRFEFVGVAFDDSTPA